MTLWWRMEFAEKYTTKNYILYYFEQNNMRIHQTEPCRNIIIDRGDMYKIHGVEDNLGFGDQWSRIETVDDL